MFFFVGYMVYDMTTQIVKHRNRRVGKKKGNSKSGDER